MLDTYKIGISSSEELELINELYQNCQRIKTPSIDKFMKDLGWTESHESKRNSELSEGMLSKLENRYRGFMFTNVFVVYFMQLI